MYTTRRRMPVKDAEYSSAFSLTQENEILGDGKIATSATRNAMSARLRNGPRVSAILGKNL